VQGKEHCKLFVSSLATLVNDLKHAWKEWESFLEKIDKSVEELAGPYSPKSISSADSKF
jgi:hypothetical protein